MQGGWHSARVRRRLGFAVCGGALAALAGVLRLWWSDAATAGVMVSAIGAFVSIAALVADVLRGDADPAPRSADEDRRRAADALAEAVREQWSAEARLRRLQDPAPLDVAWAPAERWLADHPENIRRGRPLPAPRGQRIEDVTGSFAALPGRRLVVLGGPGSGKSVLAMRFVLGRLAARRSGGPVPVIFPLAGWDPRRTGLRDWLAERLAAEHRPLAAVAEGRHTLARGLLDAGLVLPVLDGFDELSRPVYGEAVRRINAELDDDLPLLLTSRAEAWAKAVTEGDVLTAAEVVELRPLCLAQAGAHLERTARPLRPGEGAPGTVWTPVLRELTARPDCPAARALTTPLMVALARAVYGDTSRDPSELLDPDRFPTVEAVEEHLLGAFVPAAFADSGPAATSDAVRRLTLLARALERRGTGRLAWWELESMLPRAVSVLAPGLLALAMLSLVVLPVTVARAANELAGVEDLASVLATLVGQTVGFAFGEAFLLPSGDTPPNRRTLARQTLITAGVSALLWAGFAYADDLRFGFRFGAVTDGWVPDLLGGCLFSLLFTLFFGIAGLSRHPVPLSLPWSGSAGRAVARVCGAVLLLGGLALACAVATGRSGNPWTGLVGITCAGAGAALLMSGGRRAGQDLAHAPRSGRVARRFAAGAVRGTAAALLIGVTACTVAGLTAAGVTLLKSGSTDALSGRTIDGWSFTQHPGLRTAATNRELHGTLLLPGNGARPIAYPEGTRPPDCAIPLLADRRCVPFTARRTVFESRNGAVVTRLNLTDDTTTTAYAANLRSVLPEAARAWLTAGPPSGVLQRCLPPLMAGGVLVGIVGGCVCGVYRALSVPSDVMRAAGPASSLRTDRTASFTRGGLVALLVAAVCVPVVTLPGDWGGLVHIGTQLWLPLGSAALALSAWGRFTVARAWLAATGRMPWRLMTFLEDAHRRGVLRQSGAGLEFRHQRLQSHLAGRATPPAVTDRPADGPSRPREPQDRSVQAGGSLGSRPDSDHRPDSLR
ncbi:NACHT domain-containing protein [Streptomyces sp. MBT53]|uniref:NACHT domain-containing protein n=1 Tax=Streptomyces sp. MBT53 TaxID=1488384 RepID=UPI0019118B1A|nr:NACHT domain-containing protein [Streptomyces sp. MBT53]MBK6012260.1 NACHT domain-containing protein [Streptomyces sp. MBT53]